VLGSEALEDGVCVWRETNLQRAVLLVRPDAVEDDHASRSTHGNKAREGVDQLVPLLEPGRSENVVAIE
jgi:hypothetical protein